MTENQPIEVGKRHAISIVPPIVLVRYEHHRLTDLPRLDDVRAGPHGTTKKRGRIGYSGLGREHPTNWSGKHNVQCRIRFSQIDHQPVFVEDSDRINSGVAQQTACHFTFFLELLIPLLNHMSSNRRTVSEFHSLSYRDSPVEHRGIGFNSLREPGRRGPIG